MKTDFNFDWENYLICPNCSCRNPIDILHCMFCGFNLLRNSIPRVIKEANDILRKKKIV